MIEIIKLVKSFYKKTNNDIRKKNKDRLEDKLISELSHKYILYIINFENQYIKIKYIDNNTNTIDVIINKNKYDKIVDLIKNRINKQTDLFISNKNIFNFTLYSKYVNFMRQVNIFNDLSSHSNALQSEEDYSIFTKFEDYMYDYSIWFSNIDSVDISKYEKVLDFRKRKEYVRKYSFNKKWYIDSSIKEGDIINSCKGIEKLFTEIQELKEKDKLSFKLISI